MKCMGSKNRSEVFGPRCGEPARWMFADQPCCDVCAERWRVAARDPNTILNVRIGRARTEAEIAAMVRPIQ
jgi:hypothetical protein